MDKVSCIVVLQRESSQLEASLESVFSQPVGELEVVVVLDTFCSSLATLARRYGEQLHFLPNRQRLGLAASRNRGIRACQGDFVAFLDCPNRWSADKLSCQLGAFRRDPALQLCLGAVEALPAYLVDAMLCRRCVFDEVGLFEPTLEEGAEAHWFMQVFSRGVPLTVCAETVLQRNGVAGPEIEPVYQEMQRCALGRPYEQAYFQLPAGRLRLQVENHALLQAWSRAWRPYRVSGGPADLSLQVFDGWSEGWARPFEAALIHPRQYAQGLRSDWNAPYMACQRPALSLIYAVEEGRAVAGLRSAQQLLPTDLGKPVELLMLRWLAQRGCEVYHASVIAWQGRGILLVGPENSGKSTVMAACLEAGWEFVADDLVVLSRLDGPAAERVYAQGVYAGTWLESQHARRFARLGAGLLVSELDPKGLICLGDVLTPAQLLTSAPIGAVVCPRIGQAATSVGPGSPQEAWLTLVGGCSSEVAGIPNQARLDLAGAAVSQSCCLQVQLGDQLSGLAELLREALPW